MLPPRHRARQHPDAPDGRPLLLDFGAARHVSAARAAHGHPEAEYAPIEQYAESRHEPGPMDRPVRARRLVPTCSMDRLLRRRRRARSTTSAPALAKRRVPNVSARFLSAIDWALAVRPQDRPQSVAALRRALGVGAAASRPRSGHRALPAVARGTALVLRPLGAAAVVLIALAAGVALWSRAPSEAAATGSKLAAGPSVSDVDLAHGARPALPLDPVELPEPTPRPRLLPLRSSRPRPSAEPPPESCVLPTAPSRWQTVGAKARSQPKEKPVQKRKIAPTKVAAPGPNELCASSNFFMRPFCIRRLCDEPRHKARAECAPLRQAARSQRD